MSDELEGKHGVQSLEIGMGIHGEPAQRGFGPFFLLPRQAAQHPLHARGLIEQPEPEVGQRHGFDFHLCVGHGVKADRAVEQGTAQIDPVRCQDAALAVHPAPALPQTHTDLPRHQIDALRVGFTAREQARPGYLKKLVRIKLSNSSRKVAAED